MRKLLICLAGMLLFLQTAFSQSVEINGKVSDDKGNPVPGVSIQEKISKKGTTADENGMFKLTVKPGSTLFFTSIGFDKKSLVIEKPGFIEVKLVATNSALSEVVVTGSGIATDRRKLGISVESVSGEKLPATPSASIDQALIGKIPGAQISSISGNPGDPVNILLRGINTVQGGTKPLIIVDGIEVRATDINSLDLSNIERVEVVKGAASSTLYGAQGANGVIQIFTKKGKQGNVAINFSSSYASNSYVNTGHVHKAEMHPYLTDATGNLVDNTGALLKYNAVGSLPGISYTYGGAARAGIWDARNNADQPYNANIKYYDHFKEVYQTGSTLNNLVSISGATDKTDYNIQVSNNHTVTPVLKSGYLDRTNLTANVGTELFKGFKIRSITQLVYSKNTIAPGLGGPGGVGYGYGNNVAGVGGIYGFLNTSPFLDLKAKLADGTYANHVLGGAYLSVNSSNPYYYQEYGSDLGNKIDIIQNFDANYRVNKFVELDAKYGINYRNETDRWTYANQSNNVNSNFYTTWVGPYNSDNSGEIDNYQYNTTFQNFLASATIKTDFQNDFHSKLPITTSTKLGYDYRKNKYVEYDTYGLTLPFAPPINVASTASQHIASDYTEPFITYGFLVDQIINYGDYAGVAGGFRSDYSSAFGQGSKPFTFPHVNGFIAPSAFNFWKRAVPAIAYFKLRAAYGEAGIQPGAFQRYPTINQGDIGSTLTYSLQSAPSYNTGLKVEVDKETEVGFDFGINTGRSSWLSAINGAFTYWKRRSDDVIYSVSVPISSGYTSQLLNSISMSSHGFEFQLNIPVYRSKNINWDFTTNWGHQTSKINTIAGGNDIILTTSAGSSSLVLTPGQTIGQIYGHRTITSVDQKDPNGNAYIDKADVGRYVKVNGALVDTASKQIQYTPDKYYLGDPNPKFNASFINTVSY